MKMPRLFTCPDAKDMRVNLCNLVTAFQPLFLPSVLQTDKTAQSFKRIQKCCHGLQLGMQLLFCPPVLTPGEFISSIFIANSGWVLNLGLVAQTVKNLPAMGETRVPSEVGKIP